MKVLNEHDIWTIAELTHVTAETRIPDLFTHETSPLRAVADVVTAVIGAQSTAALLTGTPSMKVMINGIKVAFLLGILAERDGWYLDRELVEED